MVTVAIRPSVRVVRGRLDAHDLALLTQWIDVNRDTLIDYWNGIIEYTVSNAPQPASGWWYTQSP
jgi:hypothetical protein